MRKSTVLVCHRRVGGKHPGGRAAYSKQNLVTMSQELTTESGVERHGTALIWRAPFVQRTPSANGFRQRGRAADNSQMLVTVSRALTADHGGGFSCAEIACFADGREVPPAGGQA